MAKREPIIISKVRENILKNNLLEDGDKIVLGLSGGPDSVFLAHVLEYLKKSFKEKYNISYSIIICHINHMIRKEAGEDEELAKKYAEKYCCEFYSLHSDVQTLAKESKISEEECGRNVRYEFFNKILKEKSCTKIAVAHNAGDNAETVLHNFMRGAGLNGLCGISVKNGSIIRPILNIKKDEIIEYLDENRIEYNIDRTNKELIYTRNKIRNDLIPKIEDEYNPNIIDTINRMAEKISDDMDFIDSLAKEEYAKMIINKIKDSVRLNIREFKNKKVAIKNRVILLAIEEIIGTVKGIESKHLEEISNLFDNSITGKKFEIGNKFTINIEKNKIAKITKNVKFWYVKVLWISVFLLKIDLKYGKVK